MCMIDGADATRVSTSRTRKAMKDHKCAECGRIIAKGEQYRYNSGIDSEGSAFSHKICAHCFVVAEWLVENCGGYLCYGVLEDLREHVEEYARMDLMRLQVGMEHDWKRLRKAGLMPVPKLPRPIGLGEAR